LLRDDLDRLRDALAKSGRRILNALDWRPEGRGKAA
jgi:hypothetical protein